MSVGDGVRRIFAERLNRLVPDDDTDLIRTGVLDSLALVELVLALEETFGITVDFEGFDVEDVRSVNAITRFVAARQGDRPAAAGSQP